MVAKKKGSGGKREGAGLKPRRPGVGRLEQVSGRTPAYVADWLRGQVGKMGATLSEVVGAALEQAAQAAGARPPLSPEEIAQLERERARIDQLLAGAKGEKPGD